MFTGIIEGKGKVRRLRRSGQGMRLEVESFFPIEDTLLGDSVAVNGACLTVISRQNNVFEADVSPETISRTTMIDMATGDIVNLERGLRLSARIDGHLVSGHVDGVGTILSREICGNAIIISIEVSKVLSQYLIEKGSIAVDGISLTINNCIGNAFKVSIISHTAGKTTICEKNAGSRVNIETDLIGKYVERFIKGYDNTLRKERPSLNEELLKQAGFL
ncbi:MAG: riboflavin synthase [Pseudomonadota bacterium]